MSKEKTTTERILDDIEKAFGACNTCKNKGSEKCLECTIFQNDLYELDKEWSNDIM